MLHKLRRVVLYVNKHDDGVRVMGRGIGVYGGQPLVYEGDPSGGQRPGGIMIGWLFAQPAKKYVIGYQAEALHCVSCAHFSWETAVTSSNICVTQ